MALKLDDILVKKKEPAQILDLSKCTVGSKEELKRLLERIPEYKIKMEKIKPEEVVIRDKRFKHRFSKKHKKVKFPFANPIPTEVRTLRLEDLCSVDIQWKMLTSLRPKSKIDEEYFSRLVQIGKLTLSTRQKEKMNPISKYFRTCKNRSGVKEVRIISCRECGQEFCSGESCKIFSYDAFQRTSELITSTNLPQVEEEKIRKRKTPIKKFKKKSKSATAKTTKGKKKLSPKKKSEKLFTPKFTCSRPHLPRKKVVTNVINKLKENKKENEKKIIKLSHKKTVVRKLLKPKKKTKNIKKEKNTKIEKCEKRNEKRK